MLMGRGRARRAAASGRHRAATAEQNRADPAERRRADVDPAPAAELLAAAPGQARPPARAPH